jgi:hypothetical protein
MKKVLGMGAADTIKALKDRINKKSFDEDPLRSLGIGYKLYNESHQYLIFQFIVVVLISICMLICYGQINNETFFETNGLAGVSLVGTATAEV